MIARRDSDLTALAKMLLDKLSPSRRWLCQEELPRLVREGAVLLDVRTEAEFSSRHLSGALNAPLGRIRQDYARLDPERTYITYCSHGLRSRKVVSLLRERGFRRVVNGGPMDELGAELARAGLLPPGPATAPPAGVSRGAWWTRADRPETEAAGRERIFAHTRCPTPSLEGT